MCKFRTDLPTDWYWTETFSFDVVVFSLLLFWIRWPTDDLIERISFDELTFKLISWHTNKCCFHFAKLGGMNWLTNTKLIGFEVWVRLSDGVDIGVLVRWYRSLGKTVDSIGIGVLVRLVCWPCSEVLANPGRHVWYSGCN